MSLAEPDVVGPVTRARAGWWSRRWPTAGTPLGNDSGMALRTQFTELFSLRHPITLAPMGGSAGGVLAAAVSNGGGLGLLGGGSGDRDWLERELPIVAEGTDKPWGVGFQSWAVDMDTIERALVHKPRAVMLAFGDPRPFLGDC